jgi:exopolyphosphatase/guanosine-5'-triphosphate,3'-diphosphate pyrophosphatase
VRVAAVDIGTNTVRLLVADVDGDRIVDVDRAVEVVGLGRGLDRTGALAEDSMEAALKALTEYGRRIQDADQVRVVATSASRDASNSSDFLQQVTNAVGVAPEVISGDDEAALAFAGAVWGAGSGGRHLVIDPGGGSTEFVVGVDRPDSSASIDIGSVRLTDRLLGSRPPSSVELEDAIAHVRELFGEVSFDQSPDVVIGVAGTFTSLAAIHLKLERYDRARTHQAVLTLEDLDDLTRRLAGMTVAETAALPSLDPKRATVILSGAVIAAEAVRNSGLEAMTVSETDLLEGVVLQLSRR